MSQEKLDWQEVAWDQGFKGDDVKMLQEMLPTMTLSALAGKLGISPRSIRRRYQELGLSKK